MTRWMWKRAAAALVAGTALTTSAAAQTGRPADPEVIVLKFDGQPDRKVKVVKTTKQPDGKTATEVKDIATGETFTLLDSGPSAATPPVSSVPTPPAPPAADTGLPKAKPRTNDILTPDPIRPPLTTGAKPTPVAAKPTAPAMPAAKPTPPAVANLPVPDPVPEPARRPGPLARLFGKKPTPAPAMPAANTPPPVPVSTRAPSLPITGVPGGGIPGEPPRAMPPKPVTPPSPVVPAPLPIPTTPPNASGPQSRGGSAPVILPVGYVPADVALEQDVKPHVQTLQHALAPSARITAVKSLAGGRHGSTDQVKAAIFQTAKADPCPAVKACCIEELCKLGYFTPDFVAHVKAACADENDEVKAAAKAALVKMTPKR